MVVELNSDLDDAKKALHIWSLHEPKLQHILSGIEDAVTSISILQNSHFLQNYIKQLEHVCCIFLRFELYKLQFIEHVVNFMKIFL